MTRKVMDCRLQPSEKDCSLRISGREDEVLECGLAHAIQAHGHKDSPQLRKMLRDSLEDDLFEDDVSNRPSSADQPSTRH
jgi:hypothetical protein